MTTSQPQPLDIVVIADPYLPVPPEYYGGIERVIDILARGLSARGHDVTILAHPDTETSATLIEYGSPPHFRKSDRVRELFQVGRALLQLEKNADVIHSFGRLAALLPFLPLRIAKIQSYQRDSIPWRSVRIASVLARDSMLFTACSDSARLRSDNSSTPGAWRTIYNGVDTKRFIFEPAVREGAPLVFLGRIERIKGAHNAFEIARQAGKRLVIAGPHAEHGIEAAYFNSEIAPKLRPGEVDYIGPVNDDQKNRLLGDSCALLMPIEWNEPFGIVMVEAMACGTPVVGFRRGSVPEVVRHGVNGFVVSNNAEAVSAVANLNQISRRAVRADCEARFSDTVITDAYENAYRFLLERTRR